MGPGFAIIALIFVFAPIARAIARAIDKRGLPNTQPDPELRKALQQAEQRLADGETRLAALEERVDFYERLLANPERKNVGR